MCGSEGDRQNNMLILRAFCFRRKRMKRAKNGKGLLAVFDIGNTNVKGVLFRGSRIVKRFSVPTKACSSSSFVRRLFVSKLGRCGEKLSGVCIVSVVPKLNKFFLAACKNAAGVRPSFVTPKTIGMPIGKYKPREIGADRLVGAFAAYAICKKAVIVIGAGTAITFDAVNSKGRYLGGAIVPGIHLAVSVLAEKTAKIPFVKIRRPRRAIGMSTRECVSSGIFHGWTGLVRNVVREISLEMGAKPRVIATGKEARLLARSSGVVDEVRKDLLFEGLKILPVNRQ